ncbi:MAG: HAD family hydrolase [Lachnospiraceae bacterium]
MIKAVLFDFDYTLGDSTDGIVESTNYALENLGYHKHEKEEIKRTIGYTLEESFFLLEPKGTQEEAGLYHDYFVKKADEVMVKNTVLYPGVKEILTDLKNNGYQIGIVTTKFTYRIESIFEKYGLTGILDTIIGGDVVTKKKPDPEGIMKALGELDCEKEQVLYVGDSIVDAKCAKSANVDFAAVLTGTTVKEAFYEYPYVAILKDVQAVYQLIRKMKA